MVAPTRLTINPNLWDDKAEQVKSKIVCDDEMRSYYNDEARKLKSYLEKSLSVPTDGRTAERVDERGFGTILQSAKVQCRNGHGRNSQTDIDRIVRRISRKAPSFRCPQKRITGSSNEDYSGMNFISGQPRGAKAFVLDIDQVTADTLRNIWDFWKMNTATALFTRKSTKLYPKHAHRNPEERIRYWIVSRASELSSTGATATKDRNRPFDDFPLEECTYGTPYYITVEELHKIYGTNLMRHPQLAVQRDIFVFNV